MKLKTFKLAWESYELLERLGDRRFWNDFKSIVEEQEEAAQGKSNEGKQEPAFRSSSSASANSFSDSSSKPSTSSTTASSFGKPATTEKTEGAGTGGSNFAAKSIAGGGAALEVAKQGDALLTPKQGKNDSDGGGGSGGVTGAGSGSGKEDNDDDSAAKKKPPASAAPEAGRGVEESKGESDSEARGEGDRIKVEDLKKWSDRIAKKPSTDVFSFEIIRDVFSNQLNQNGKKMIAKWSEWYRVVRFRLFLAKPIFEFLSSYLQMTFI